jgi:hypothetical protein
MSTPANTITENPTPPIATGVTPQRLRTLRRWNIGLTILHLGQAAAMLILANNFAIPVLSAYTAGRPGTLGLTTSNLFDLRIGWAIALFLGLAGLDHFLTASLGRKIYERDLTRGINRFRWLEYSISATIMVIVISMYWGIVTINALIAIAGANVAMILFGWLQEKMNPPGRTTTTMLPFWFGALVGLTPWIAMAVNISLLKDENLPASLYIILIVQGVFFFCFGLNQWLQYRQVGPWRNYAFGEKTYLVLSLAAKSLLAWQIFAVSLFS